MLLSQLEAIISNSFPQYKVQNCHPFSDKAEPILSYSGFSSANRLKSPSFIDQTPATKEKGPHSSLLLKFEQRERGFIE
jgi:hypothetical protein